MNFNFDVAFSFLKDDLSFAFEIKKHLQSTIRTFIYADKQEVLAGKDGPAKFRSVFKNESRLVVILYRSKYGDTQYTSVERDAIAARALETKWDFVILIPFEKPIPDWYPYSYSYIDPYIHRADQIASIIEYKLLELGSEFKQETLIDKAERIKREKDFEHERLKILSSPETMRQAENLFDEFYKILKDKTAVLSEIIDLKLYSNNTRFNGFRQTYGFHKVNDNARETYLQILTEKLTFNDVNNKMISKVEVKLDINESKVLGWSYEGNIIDSKCLVEKVLTKLVELK